jgi:hypothetical protein
LTDSKHKTTISQRGGKRRVDIREGGGWRESDRERGEG